MYIIDIIYYFIYYLLHILYIIYYHIIFLVVCNFFFYTLISFHLLLIIAVSISFCKGLDLIHSRRFRNDIEILEKKYFFKFSSNTYTFRNFVAKHVGTPGPKHARHVGMCARKHARHVGT